MASEARLYTFSQPTKDQLRKFRLGTSRAKDPQAMICMSAFSTTSVDALSRGNLEDTNYIRWRKQDQIDKESMEIKAAEDGQVYKNLDELEEDLPDHTPRFILLSYPMQLDSGRLSVPYVMINYLPPTTSSEMRMLYAGAKELMRNQSEVGRVIDIDDAEDLRDIEEKLKGPDP